MDQDNDGIEDHLDLDDDNDGILDADEGGPIPGAGSLFQISGHRLFEYNPLTGSFDPVGDATDLRVNALAYDNNGTAGFADDDVMYATVQEAGDDSFNTPTAAGDLVTIDPATGDVTRVADIVLTDTSGSTVATTGNSSGFFSDGSYFVRNDNRLFEIDIDSLSGTPPTVTGTELPGSDGFEPRDIVEVGGVIYGVHDDELYSYDTNATTPVLQTTELAGTGGTSVNYGSVWIIDNDRIVLQNNDGGLYEVTGFDPDSPTTPTINLLLDAAPTSQNDGAGDPSVSIPSLVDTDGDGIADFQDADSDNDGISDIVESGIDASLYDTDGNGTIDPDEIVDTNDDGLDDRIDLVDGTLDGQVAGPRDTDGDGIADYLDLDSDNDGISDLEEAGVNPALDADGNGAIDINDDGTADEAADVNRDGLADVLQTPGLDTTPVDTDEDGIADYVDLDSDDDGISDYIESQSSEDFVPYDATDSDGDGIIDLADDDTGPDAEFGGNFSAPVDTDDDGDADYIDTDADDDLALDIDESGLTTTGNSTNGIDDGSGVTFADQDGQADNTLTGVDGLEDYLENTTDPDTTEVDFRSRQDSDGDNIADVDDIDDDNDGILDVDEGTGDSDGDGIVDRLDLDRDNDGITDLEEGGLDTDVFDSDGDGRIDGDDFDDTDMDGLADGVDALDGTPLDGQTNRPVDTDGDGTADTVDLDSDNDGITDLRESGADPSIDADGDGTIDINPDGSAGGESADLNGDGIADALQGPGSVLVAEDTDDDGVADYLDLDSDNDGISDLEEAGVDPSLDADGDGTIDTPEDTSSRTVYEDANDDGLVDILQGPTIDLTPADTDDDGIADYLDLDSDDDGISDYIESQSSADFTPYDATDSDGDGIIDLADNDSGPDAEFGGNFSTPIDTNDDGEADYVDTDADGDLALDIDESGLTTTGSSTNGIDDGSGVTFADQDGQASNSENGVAGLQDYLDNTSDVDTTDVDFRSVPCFTRGTKIRTITGEKPIEDMKVGDRVFTLDLGFQEIRWIGSYNVTPEKLKQHPKLNPVLIKAGALGQNTPAEDLLVSRQHRVLLRSKIAERMFGEREVLVAAIKLTELDGVEEVQAPNGVEYFHFLFDEHQIVFSNSAQTESLLKGPEALRTLSADAVSEIRLLFPEVLDPSFEPKAARKIPVEGKRIKKLCERVSLNRKAPVEELRSAPAY